MDLSSNPYAPPKAQVRDVAAAGAAPPLWNPNAAANWSLLFTPVFGALVQMKNWQALEEPGEATTARNWAILTVVVMIALPIADLFLVSSRSTLRLPQSLGWIPLIAWYFAHGRSQIRYVKERFGNDYPRRNLAVPLLVAFATILGVVGLLMAVGIGVHTVAGR